MRDNKAFASLSSGLLARKGQARPAMRPQGFGPGLGQPDDLGWNDMGYDAASAPAPRIAVRLPADLSGPRAELPATAEVPPVVHQQDEIAREFGATPEQPRPKKASPRRKPAAAPEAAATTSAAAAADTAGIARRAGGRKAAFTLRLDADRHLRLRLACAVENRSAQLLVIEALDRFLTTLPDVERLAASLPDDRPAA